jgi:hypothetical protein
MPENSSDIVVSNLRGGRNGIDSPLELPDNQCVDALNVDWSDGPLGRKRPGAIPVDTTGGTAFTAAIYDLFRHIPGGNGELAELWAIDSLGVVKRMAGGTVFVDVTLDDAITGNFQDVHAASFNGKLFLAYKSAVNRLHVWDPLVNAVRRVGLAAPTGAPTVADTGAGAYPAVERFYRTRVLQMDGIKVVRKSEPSAASVSFTPSGSGSAARVTRVGAPGEHETHWEVEVSLDNAIWFVLAGVDGLDPPIAIGTSTYDDDTLTEDYLDLTTSEEIGSYTLPISAKWLSTDSNRLLMANSWTTTEKTSRIYLTAVLGASDRGDDERVIITDVTKGYIDLNEKDGGEITGISMPVDGIIFSFKYEQIYRGTPTGNADAPYIFRRVRGTTGAGCIYQKTIVQAENTAGETVVAFLSRTGPYRVSVGGGVEYMGRDMEDVWYGVNNYLTMINIHATLMVAHGIFHQDLHQIWWYIACKDVGGSGRDSPELKMMVDTRCQTMKDEYGVRGGWARHTGKSCKAVCSVMFANTLGASMSLDLRPYIGYREPA